MASGDGETPLGAAISIQTKELVFVHGKLASDARRVTGKCFLHLNGTCNPNDVKLTLRAFKTANLANTVHVARDGVEALEFLFGTTTSTDQKVPEKPKLILLDLK